MSSMATQLMTNKNECYQHALAQSDIITELLLEGHCVDCINVGINKFTSRLEYVKAALSTTAATKTLALGLYAEWAWAMLLGHMQRIYTWM